MLTVVAVPTSTAAIRRLSSPILKLIISSVLKAFMNKNAPGKNGAGNKEEKKNVFWPYGNYENTQKK